MTTVNVLMLGAIAMGAFTASLFFLRFWRDTRDPLFLAFSLAFALEGATRAASPLVLPNLSEGDPRIYGVRLIAYLLILLAIAHKNLKKS